MVGRGESVLIRDWQGNDLRLTAAQLLGVSWCVVEDEFEWRELCGGRVRCGAVSYVFVLALVGKLVVRLHNPGARSILCWAAERA